MAKAIGGGMGGWLLNSIGMLLRIHCELSELSRSLISDSIKVPWSVMRLRFLVLRRGKAVLMQVRFLWRCFYLVYKIPTPLCHNRLILEMASRQLHSLLAVSGSTSHHTIRQSYTHWSLLYSEYRFFGCFNKPNSKSSKWYHGPITYTRP